MRSPRAKRATQCVATLSAFTPTRLLVPSFLYLKRKTSPP